ncbi:hypothetical protein [Kiloniella sp. b19]|uniref:hypothetical protein n=1 Tax=Kiloniella sp. GXU_MW_B19 TaxID=3141326 RepID=UPI0031DAF3F5
MDAFLSALKAIPEGYSTGLYRGYSYGTTLLVSADGKRVKLYAEELGGNDHISFNLYHTAGKGPLLKPCEMPAEKVMAFVLGYELSATATHSAD